MLYISTIISIIEVLIVVVPSLLVVAFITIAERKTMASMQRRLGPNAVGWYGLLQAFADALKLLLKEYVSPTQANIILFFLGPIITLIFSLLGYAIIPYSPGLAILDFNLSILYALAVSSLATYGILLAGWSANSKYAFLGSLRSTAQLISYELILSSAILLVVLLVGSLNIGVIVEAQRYVWFIIPLFPIFIIFFIGAVAETNRAPFDLAEAESELVSGFMTEHSAVIFVFFFLAEYASIVLICITTCILFLGGYLLSLNLLDIVLSTSRSIYDVLNYFYFSNSNYLPDNDPNSTKSNLTYVSFYYSYYLDYFYSFSNYSLIEGLFNAFILGVKSSIMIFTFIWVRASFPRIRFDELMSYCWTVLLPILIGFIVLVPFILYSFYTIPSNISLLMGLWTLNPRFKGDNPIFKDENSGYKIYLTWVKDQYMYNNTCNSLTSFLKDTQNRAKYLCDIKNLHYIHSSIGLHNTSTDFTFSTDYCKKTIYCTGPFLSLSVVLQIIPMNIACKIVHLPHDDYVKFIDHGDHALNKLNF